MWRWTLLAVAVVGALILVGPHVWKFYIAPKDALDAAIAACAGEGTRRFGAAEAKEREAWEATVKRDPARAIQPRPFGAVAFQRGDFVEDCIRKQGWCVVSDQYRSFHLRGFPATDDADFLPDDSLAAQLFTFRYLAHPASCE
jgi:hypothetical protein